MYVYLCECTPGVTPVEIRTGCQTPARTQICSSATAPSTPVRASSPSPTQLFLSLCIYEDAKALNKVSKMLIFDKLIYL